MFINKSTMPENFLISASLHLDALSKEMLYCLNHYPLLPIKHEKIEYLCDRFRLLFNGEYRSVKFLTAMLHSCIMQYCECILIFVQDNSMKKDKVDYLRRWLSVLDNLAGVNSLKNKFIFLMPVLENLIDNDQLTPWVKKEFMLHLNRVLEQSTQLIFNDEKEEKIFFRIVEGWLILIENCGDYEFQTILVEAIISSCELGHIEEVLLRKFGGTHDLTRMFLDVYGKQNYLNDLKTFLKSINDRFDHVHSVPCLKVTLEQTVIPPLKGMNADETWIHINYGFFTLSFDCQQDSLRSLPGSDNHSNFYEFVTVNFEDIDKVCLLINNDSKTVNPVGGMFLLYLSGKCSCRFDSSKDIVSSITKITLAVPDGSSLQYLKKAFVKLFGSRFKEANNLPLIKKNFYDKRYSPINSSSNLSSNSSYRVEKRRRRRKRKDSIDTNPGSIFLKNFKQENSFTLENKENVSEGTKSYSLNSTESSFKMPVVADHKKLTNSQRSISPTIRLINNKENEIKNWLSTKKYLSAKVENDLENDRLMSVDTKSNPTNESEGKGGRSTSKNNFSLLESFIDTRTTSKNKEIPESSKISLVAATTEEMTIPSNYKFGEDNSLTTLDENRSAIFDFINSSIPDLRSPLNLKNKSSKAKSFGIADSSASRTISNVNIQAKTSSQDNQANLPEMTFKSNQNTSLAISNKPLKRLRKSRKNERKMQKKKRINQSGTVGRLLRSSVRLESAEKNSEICEALGEKNKNVKETKKADLLTLDTEDITSTENNKTYNFNLNNNESMGEFNLLKDDSETPDINSMLARSTKIITRPKNLDEEVIEIIDDDPTVEDELNGNNENTSKEMRNDNINITSISSIKEIHLDASTEVMVDLNQQIENRQYDIAETTADAQKLLILEINDIQVASENHQHRSSNQVLSEHNYSLAEKIEMAVDVEVNDIQVTSENHQHRSSNQVLSEHNYFLAEKIEMAVDVAVIEVNDIQVASDNHQDSSSNQVLSERDYSFAEKIEMDVDVAVIEVNDIQVASENHQDSSSNHVLSERDYSFAEKIEMAVDVAVIEINDIQVASENHQDRSSNQVLSEHNYSLAEKIVKYDVAVIEEIQILAIKDVITNDHCYASNSAPMHEIANETKSDKDHSVDDTSAPTELAQLTDVSILSNEIDYREKASPIVGLKELENSFQSMTTKSMEHVVSLDEQNAFVNKINILSNINDINESQLLQEQYVATCNSYQETQNEIARLYAEIACKTQRIEELERQNQETLELTQTSNRKKSVTSERKRTKEHITSQSEIYSGKFQKSFQEFIESPCNHLPDNNFLIDNEETDFELNSSQTETDKSMEIDFEMLIPRNDLNSQELTSSPKISLFDMIATNGKQNVTSLNRELQKSSLNNAVVKVQNETMSDGGEFSKNSLSGKTTTPEKNIKLAENVQLSPNMHKLEENNFVKFTLETSPLKSNKPRKSTSLPKTHQSKEVNDDLSFIQGFESIPPFESVKVRKNSLEKLEESGLISKQSTKSGNKFNKSIEFDFNIKTGNAELYNLIDKPHKLSEKSDKTEEDIGNKSNTVHRDENYYKRTNEIYGFDAMLDGLKWYLNTLKPPVERKKKPQKRRIIKMKLGGQQKAKSKTKKKNRVKLF